MKFVALCFGLILLSFVVVSAEEGWKRLDTSPESSNLSSVDCVDDLVVSVGSYGVVKYSKDFGKTWIASQTATEKNLNSVCFYDKDEIISVGDEGALLVSNDKSHSWLKVNSNTKHDLYNVKYFNKEYGIIVGSDGYLAESYGSKDKWVQLDTKSDNDFYKAVIFQKDQAIVCGENCEIQIKTPKSGWTSKKLDTAGKFVKMKKINNTTALIVSDKLKAYFTTDKGETWSSAYIDEENREQSNRISYIGVYKENVYVFINSTKYIYGSYVTSSREYTSVNLSEWEKIIKNSLNSAYFSNDLYFDQQRAEGFAVGQGGLIGHAYLNLQKGFNIEFYDSPVDSGILDFYALNSKEMLTINSEKGRFLKSFDSGKNWISQSLNMNIGNLENIYSPDMEHYYISVDDVWYEDNPDGSSSLAEAGMFIKVDNAGNVLTNHRFENGGGHIGMEFLNKDYGILYTWSSCRVTTDGGNTWSFVLRRIPETIVREMSTPEPGYIVSLEVPFKEDSTYISISTDYGDSWIEKESPHKFSKIEVLDRNTFMAHFREYADDKVPRYRLFITRDAADTWEEIVFDDTYSTVDYINYKMYDGKIMIVTGGHPDNIYISEDDGETWEKTEANFTNKVWNPDISKIQIVDNNPLLVSRRRFVYVPEGFTNVEDSNEKVESVQCEIYPNPASKNITINAENFDFSRIKIYNSQGDLYLEQECRNNTNVNIESIPIGTYYIMMYDNKQRHISKILNVTR